MTKIKRRENIQQSNLRYFDRMKVRKKAEEVDKILKHYAKANTLILQYCLQYYSPCR